MRMKSPSLLSTLLITLSLFACGGSNGADDGADDGADVRQEATVPESPEPAGEPPPEDALVQPGIEEIQEDLGIPALSRTWTGDLDGMEQRRVIRVLTVYGLVRYFFDGAQERGLTYELFKMFEEFINQRLGRKQLKVHVMLLPVARDELIPALLEGRGDIAAAGLTITPERAELIDFTRPASRPLSEILVTGPSAPPVGSIEDLAGQSVYVRASSSYRSSLDSLNQRLREQGLEEIDLQFASEYLEDEDLLEMVNAGLLDWAVVDDYKARIWTDILDGLVIRDDIVFREGGRLGFAIRKDSPLLMEALNDFLKSHRQGTLKGNILINRYVKEFDWAKNALAAEDYERFEAVVEIFERYGSEYGLDYLLVTAQGYQESKLDQSMRSPAGAVGIMQLLPSTAADPNVGIPDISKAESNIHAGVRYLNFIRNRYFSDPELDDFNRTVFSLAAYNAGPARIARLRRQAEQQGYDPNRWFDHVEVIAAREIGRETVQYVANILKYYAAYRLSVIRQMQRFEERKGQGIE
jgi:membrane-bound lytic murein transglycosylase MltF